MRSCWRPCGGIAANGWRFGLWLSGHTSCGWKHIEGSATMPTHGRPRGISTTGLVIRRCTFRGNIKGLWQDYGGDEMTIDRCLFEDNENGGFDNEMTEGVTIITDSVFRNNGYFSIRAYGASGMIIQNSWLYSPRTNAKVDKTLYCNNLLFISDSRDNVRGRKATIEGMIIADSTIVATSKDGNNFWMVDWRDKDDREVSLEEQFHHTVASDFNTWFVRAKPYYGAKYFMGVDGEPSDFEPDLTFEQWRALDPTSGFKLDAHSKWEDPGDEALAAVADPTKKPEGNQKLSAIPDTARPPAGKAGVIDVLANDFDADGDKLTLSGVSLQPAHGTARIDGGKLVYTPAEGYTGGDVLRYTVSDGQGGADTAMVMIAAGAKY